MSTKMMIPRTSLFFSLRPQAQMGLMGGHFQHQLRQLSSHVSPTIISNNRTNNNNAQLRTNNIDDLIAQEPLVQTLRHDPSFKESRPHLTMPMALKPGHFVAGALSGPGKVSVAPYIWSTTSSSSSTNTDTNTNGIGIGMGTGNSKIVSIFHIGPDLCGHPGFVHGGLLTVLFDEVFARCVSNSFRSGLGMTANLNVDYRKPAVPDRLYVLQAETVRVEGRKAWVEGKMTSLPNRTGNGNGNGEEQPVMVAEAKALFVEPKFVESMVPLYKD